MNEIGSKVTLFNKAKILIKGNTKNIIFLFVLLFIIFLGFQFYLFGKSKSILEDSIRYNSIIDNEKNPNFEQIIEDLSLENNFYGILATLKKISNKLNNGDFISSYDDYLNLINNKKLNNIYKAALAVHGSYSFLDEMSRSLSSLSDQEILDINIKIENLLLLVDPKLSSFEGFNLEVKYLLSLIKGGKLYNKNKSNELYEQIQKNDKISPSLKERVKKIHEFQKYK